MKRIPEEKKAECIRLRLREQLSTPTIARRVGLCNHSVYKILAKHPWKGVRVSHREWSRSEIDALVRLWPIAEEKELLAALPKRALTAIVKKASELGIRRPLPAYRHNKRPIHPIIKRLRLEREKRRLTRAEVADRAGYHLNQIQAWEQGKQWPNFRRLVDWCAALGMKLVVHPITGPDPAEKVPLPSREALMAGR